MMISCVIGGKCGRLSSLGLLQLLLTALHEVPFCNAQQVGVSLKLQGVTIPNNSLVDFDDLLYTINDDQNPTNANGHDQTLVCETDLVDCCDAPRTVRGNWYLPNGAVVTNTGNPTFQSNRGPNEERNGQQFYGSVRIFRRYAPPQRGRFRCELPSAADPNVNQTLCANIVNFGTDFRLPPVTISPSGSTGIAGETYSLMCSTTLHLSSIPLPSDVPSPTFEWFFGPNNSSLSSGVTSPETTFDNLDTYTSTLQFSPLSQSHAGMYTCRLGPGRLASHAMVTVNAPTISVQITASGAPMLGQNGYSLTCGVNGAHNLNASIIYQWTKNNGTQTQIQVGANPAVLSFSPLKLSDAGRYTCNITVSSLHLDNDIIMKGSEDVTIQISVPISVVLLSSIPNPIPPFGSDVTLSCTVLVPSGPEIDIPLNVNFELLRTDPAGSPLTITPLPVSGSTHTAIASISSFGRSDSGNYTCRASVSSASINTFISDSNTESHSTGVTTGVYLALRGAFIANNSQVNIRNIGQSSDSPNGALQCITDRSPCCATPPNRRGEWYLPNGALVQGTTSTTAVYRNRGDNGEVSLNRPSDVMSPIGLFCCEVPDATDTNQTLCVNTGTIFVVVSGSPVAGESYTLECSAGGFMASFLWLGPPDGITPFVESSSRTIVSNSTASQLQFRPLQQSHNGSYSCSVSTGGQNLISQPIVVSVNAPSVSVQITDGGAAPTAGENYELTCTINEAENLNPTTVTYQWTENQIQVGTSNTLSFTPLRLSDAANFVCSVTISSSYLSGDIVPMNSQDIRIQIPTPSSIMLTSSDGNSLQIVGSDVTLTCIVELNPAIVASDLPLLMVDAQLSRDGIPLALTGPTVTGTTITYTTQLVSFGRSDSGNYTCTATVRPRPSSTYLTGSETLLSDIVSIKAALTPPVNVQATQSSSSAPVEISWSPPSDGATNISGYKIFFGNGQSALVPSVATYIGLRVDGNFIGQNVSIRSESDQLYSEFISASVIMEHDDTMDMTMCSCSCSNEVGIAVGVIIIVVCLVVMVITVIIVLYWWRGRSSRKNEFAVSANMAYGEVNLKHEEIGGQYENPDKILRSCRQWSETTRAAASTYETVYSNPAASEYTTIDETVCATSKQQPD